jgi:hypothetical protein
MATVAKTRRAATPSTEKSLRCTFCGKGVDDVALLIKGPDVYICEECVDLCAEILLDHMEDTPSLNLLPTIAKAKRKIPELDLHEMGLSPRFKRIRFARKKGHCFYLCPFAEPFNAIFYDHVKPSLEREGFSVERADEIFGTDPIIEDIWEGINSCEVVIADVTGRNPNVMYEIGMAHTVGKPVLILTQNIDDVPFDLKQYRCIVYQYTPPGCRHLEEKVVGTLRFIQGRDHPAAPQAH